ncbi:MAG: hypothetical protein PHE18_06785 [Candidatus Omnitrophica bacterium]|nr:hypothetical protein [Candidatus Omnitrophota bacterium]MDD5553565.1 hypothetical protein [Candidatus Omnitrophota bacterium]
MRDILLRNITSEAKKRRILTSSETTDKGGVRSIVRRHFVYMAKPVQDKHANKPDPYLYVLKKHDNAQKIEEFFCRIKGSMYAAHEGKLFLVYFMHSLKITLMPSAQNSLKS